eukprot:RCo044757
MEGPLCTPAPLHQRQGKKVMVTSPKTARTPSPEPSCTPTPASLSSTATTSSSSSSEKPVKRKSSLPLLEKSLSQSGAQSKAELSVELILSEDRDSKLGKPYHEDGDPSMYTEQNLQKRARLKENSSVVDAITRFSKLFPVSSGSVTVEHSAYLVSHRKLARVLRPSLTDEELAALGEEDWRNDTQGTGVLSAEMLRDILFQFVDMWTQTTDPTEYLVLLDQLYLKVCDVP